MTQPQYKTPISRGSSSTDTAYAYVKILSVDTDNKIANVIDQLGIPLKISVTRSYGRQYSYPNVGEEWIATRQFGDWVLAVCVNPELAAGIIPAGGDAQAVLAKNSANDYDVSWVDGTPAPTPSTYALRDSNGRMQSVDPASPQDVATKNYTDSSIQQSALVPTGSLMPFGGSAAPTGWVIADGSPLSRTTYASLFAVIGTTYGAGDGSTTFNLPNLLGKTIVGYDGSQTEFNAVGKTGGEKTHVLSVTEMPSHTHTQNAHTHTDAGHAHGIQVGNANGGLTAGSTRSIQQNSGTTAGTSQVDYASINSTTATNQNTGGGAAHNNLQPYMAMKYIIKT